MRDRERRWERVKEKKNGWERVEESKRVRERLYIERDSIADFALTIMDTARNPLTIIFHKPHATCRICIMALAGGPTVSNRVIRETGTSH